MPGKKYRSIKHPRVYEALRGQGMSKKKAARISNASGKKGKRKK
jgi:hypothetical protein